jgi:hypothetical protein
MTWQGLGKKGRTKEATRGISNWRSNDIDELMYRTIWIFSPEEYPFFWRRSP